MIDLTNAQGVADALSRAQIPFALGGSGLLCSLGLAEEMRDIDLTTDAPLPVVAEALNGFTWRQATHGDPPFASEYRLSIETSGPPIDLMGRFAIQTEHRVCRLPTIVTATWRGLPVGSAEVWAMAYRLMNRHAKADLLSEYLRQNPVQCDVVELLLGQPLPAPLRNELASWRYSSVRSVPQAMQ